MTQEAYQYWAFISYSRKDEAAALALKAALGRTWAPLFANSLLTGKPSGLSDFVPRRFAEVFLDQDNISAASNLDEELKRQLRAARHLIVICSPRAVASPYVDAEIAYFKSLGRGDRISCVRVYGEPNDEDAGGSLECFPRAIRHVVDENGKITEQLIPIAERPIAIDFMSDRARTIAVAQLRAALVGETPDSLKRRIRTGLARRSLAGGAAAAAMILAGGFVWLGWFADAHVDSREYVRRWGQWRPVDRLGLGERRTLDFHYRFTTQGWFGRTKRVDILDRSGVCTEKGLDSILGNTLSTQCGIQRACSVKFDYYDRRRVRTEQLLDQDGRPLETLTYEPGQDVVARFVEGGLGCSRSLSGINHIKFRRITSGRLAGLNDRIEFLYDDNDRTEARPNDLGFATLEVDYDDHARVTELRRLSPQDKLAPIPEDGSRIRFERDGSGRVLKELHYDENGRPMLAQKDGCHGHAYAYRGGFEISDTCLGLDGSPAFDSRSVSIRRYRRNSRGDAVETSFFGPDGQPTVEIGWSEASQLKSRFDARGLEVETAWFDVDGRPLLDAAGMHRQVQTFEDQGRITSITLFGTDGRRTRADDWWSRKEFLYDPGRRWVEYRYFDEQDRPIADKEFKAPRVRRNYDPKGLFAGYEFFDAGGRPIGDPDGEHRQVFGIGPDRDKDERGRRISVAHFGPAGNPIMLPDGQGVVRLEHRQGQVVRQSNFDPASGAPMNDAHGEARVEFKFDDFGRRTERRSFDAKGVEVNRETTAYGADGRVQETRTWLHGQPEHIMRISYPVEGVTETRTFDSGDRLLSIDRERKSPQGWVISTAHLNAAGDGLEQHMAYDERGQEIEIAWFKSGGAPAAGEEGWQRERIQRDRFGNALQMSYFGPSGEPAIGKDGCHVTRDRFDGVQQRVARQCLGPDLRSTDFKGRQASAIACTWDNRRLLSGADLTGSPEAGPARIRFRYDAFARPLAATLLGADGKPLTASPDLTGAADWARAVCEDG